MKNMSGAFIQGLADGIEIAKRRNRVKLENLLRSAMPDYDKVCTHTWSMDKLIDSILEITCGSK
jgi:hypothetical protein